MTVQIAKQVWDAFLGIFNSPTKAFALIATIFGTLIIVASPPFTGADEEAHFIRAYGITEGVILMRNGNEVEVPESIRKTVGCFQNKTSEAGITNIICLVFPLSSKQ